jgi:adenylyltransferase/sulfurtransferase
MNEKNADGLTENMRERYKRQITFDGIGVEGQRKLSAARVCVIGVGAAGAIIANTLCRAGVGFLRLVDRGYVEETNLLRQILFTERDVAENTPKAIAVAAHVAEVDGGITVEPLVTDVNSSNIEKVVRDVDLVLDGTDNFETRFLINEACHKHRIPWIYGGTVASGGATMNVRWDDGPCFRCFMPEIPEAGSYPTCSSAGVILPITSIIASYQSAEALKILTGAEEAVSRRYLAIDVWDNMAEYIEVEKNPDCPVCGHGTYELLDKPASSYAVSLCGQDAWQVIPEGISGADFTALSKRLEKLGTVTTSEFLLRFDGDGVSFKLFPDGRAIISGTQDDASARATYVEYIGL